MENPWIGYDGGYVDLTRDEFIKDVRDSVVIPLIPMLLRMPMITLVPRAEPRNPNHPTPGQE